IELLHVCERFQILFRDLGDRDIVNIHLVFLDQFEQQVERPVINRQLYIETCSDFFFFIFFRHFLSPMAFMVSRSVSTATLRARSRPSSSIFRISDFFSTQSSRRLRIGSINLFSAPAISILHSTHPRSALRHSFATVGTFAALKSL